MRGVGWKTLLASGLLIVVVLGSSFWLMTEDQQRRYNENLTRQLLAAARLLRESLRGNWQSFEPAKVAGLVHTLRSDGVSVVIMSADGHAFVNTTGVPQVVEELRDRPEVRNALLVGSGVSTRPLWGELRESRVVAVRAGDDESTLGVVWLARPCWTLGAAWHSLGKLAAAIGTIALVGTLALGIVLTQLRARLLHRLAETAQSLSAGDLSAKADIVGSDEYAMLSAALNQTRRRLALQVETINRQRLTLESLVEQLHEGVVVARENGRIVLINPSALRLLNLTGEEQADPARLIGLPLERCIPQHELQRMLRGESVPRVAADVRSERGTLEDDMLAALQHEEETRVQVSTATGERHLLARVSDLTLPGDAPTQDESSPGRMLVLTDITELARIIRIKTDFVANASHELRTPLSAIRAAVETLLHIDLAEDTAAARRFLETVDRQTRRLEAMVTDLLDLSRLESPMTRFEPQPLSIQKELDELQTRFADRLEAKGIAWETHALNGAVQTVVTHAHLLRLVLDNLLDNAIKFTESGGHVRVACAAGPGWLSFEVTDDGCGIPEAEQERVFERFYQIERARSGEQRGTGLGLAIVRHAAAAMNGTVTLKSKPGEGTRVTIRVPQPPSAAPGVADSSGTAAI